MYIYNSLVVSGNFLFAVSGRNTTNVPDIIVNVLKNANGKDARYFIYRPNKTLEISGTVQSKETINLPIVVFEVLPSL